jgi:NADH-quinone oxidoreductase subunit L
MMEYLLILPIFIPLIAGLLAVVEINHKNYIREAISLLAVAANLIVTYALFDKKYAFSIPWAGFGMDISLRIYHFSAFILLASAAVAALIALYSIMFMNGREKNNYFYLYFMLTLSFTNGAVLAENLILMLFFWEGLLAVLLGFIAIGGKGSFKTALKAFVIIGVSDLCLMFGIALTYSLCGTLNMSEVTLPMTFMGGVAFISLMLGAISKAGSMPFHSWIPDAANDAPLPFMALIPAALEKFLGIYFLSRICLDMYKIEHGSPLSITVMTIGAITILAAVMMALIQKDYKKLLSYHAISQVGYMVLGIGTAVPVGIVGGIFHMLNHVLYKSCLFLTGGSVERQAGTTDLSKLGGLGKKMPVTFGCFLVAALSISGVPPFNGFFSKELVYDGALESGTVFYIAAVCGSFLTAASFLKLGHAAFLGKEQPVFSKLKEAPLLMLIPMLTLAGLCILFGVYNPLPLHTLIQPILGARLEGHDFAGLPTNLFLVIATVAVLALAVINHIWGYRRTGSAIKAVDHIHYAPLLHGLYDRAERKFFDPYDVGLKLVNILALSAWRIDRAIDYFYTKIVVGFTQAASGSIKACHTGSHATYIVWTVVGLSCMIYYVAFR